MADSGNDSDSTVGYDRDGVGYCFGIFDPWFFDTSDTKAARLARKLNLQLLPPSHFASQGYDDFYSNILAQKVQRKLIGFIGQMKFKGAKKLTCDRYKYVNLNLGHTLVEDDYLPYGNILASYEYDDRDHLTMVNNERAFLPLWTAFVHELQNFAQQCQARRHTTWFIVHNMEMTPDVANMIATSLRGTHCLSRLEFDNVGADDEVVKIAVKIAQESFLLEQFHLKRVPINNDAAQCLASMAENHPRLDDIRLVDCGLRNNLDALEIIVHAIKDMDRVHISENDMGPGASYVSAMNPNTGGCFAIKNMTDAGVAMIKEAVVPSGSIPNFVNSFYNASDKGELDLESRLGSKLHMQFRLFNLLDAWRTTKYLNCHYLNELPVELMPYLLNFLQSARGVVSRWYRERECEDPMMKNNLQIVYEALASVVVPLRFVPSSSANKRLKSG